jgi:hypothetical protein
MLKIELDINSSFPLLKVISIMPLSYVDIRCRFVVGVSCVLACFTKDETASELVTFPCGDWSGYPHVSLAIRRRRQKGSPVPRGITGPPCHGGT